MSVPRAYTHCFDPYITAEYNIKFSCRYALCGANRATEPTFSGSQVVFLGQNFNMPLLLVTLSYKRQEGIKMTAWLS